MLPERRASQREPAKSGANVHGKKPDQPVTFIDEQEFDLIRFGVLLQRRQQKPRFVKYIGFRCRPAQGLPGGEVVGQGRSVPQSRDANLAC